MQEEARAALKAAQAKASEGGGAAGGGGGGDSGLEDEDMGVSDDEGKKAQRGAGGRKRTVIELDDSDEEQEDVSVGCWGCSSIGGCRFDQSDPVQSRGRPKSDNAWILAALTFRLGFLDAEGVRSTRVLHHLIVAFLISDRPSHFFMRLELFKSLDSPPSHTHTHTPPPGASRQACGSAGRRQARRVSRYGERHRQRAAAGRQHGQGGVWE